ncbi:HAMP domain-containing sensor histidine kinase [Treponema socranskii]|uniref:HAMP domain-containing sensor histidine kinase n=1 Tax=Treponema socranskii TaxID=53419 RepID=UPI0028E43304|nr:HAMP domain-containing sensor histidine kinase [Treponema socranskii]
MTIRRQFHILLAAIIVIPICCALFIPSYHYFTSPVRALIHDYKELRKSDTFKLSVREWSKLHDYIRRLPPDMEVAVFSLSGSADILISSIAELKAGTSLSPLALWGFASSTSDTYFYQFTSFRFSGRNDTIVILTRVDKFNKRDRHGMDYVNYLVGILLCFAVLVLIIIAKISGDIFTSITILEQRTQKIADGDLSVPITDDAKQSKAKSNEIISLTENLEKMRSALLDAHERRTRFIMGISHDLRTPVAVIKGYTEAISDDVITDKNEIKKSLEIIATKTNRLESMIDTLINFVKLDSADWRQKLVPESVFTVVSEFVKSAEMTGAVFKRKIKSAIALSPECKVPMDRQLFSRALENLLSNAIRYSKDGDEIAISATETDDACIVSVSDTGIGIAKKDLDHIFDMFYRATDSRREEGMGIGLSVVKSIVDTHGWTIGVASEAGKGSTFTITIPKKAERGTHCFS